VRNGFGALCGYVGVPESHPLYGTDYSAESDALRSALDRLLKTPMAEVEMTFARSLAALGGDARPSPEMVFGVHGGLTFSGYCQEPTFEEWIRESERAADPALRREAATYPKGDAARRLERANQAQAMTFEEWADHEMARRICHVPEPGRPARVWWFGFDCAHAGDLAPDMTRHYAFERDETYRTVQYVEGECTDLAAQLASMDVAHA
jgi:hypothetical protein